MLRMLGTSISLHQRYSPRQGLSSSSYGKSFGRLASVLELGTFPNIEGQDQDACPILGLPNATGVFVLPSLQIGHDRVLFITDGYPQRIETFQAGRRRECQGRITSVLA